MEYKQSLQVHTYIQHKNIKKKAFRRGIARVTNVIITDFYIVLDSELPSRIEASMSVGNCMVFYKANKIKYGLFCIVFYYF